MALIFDPDLLNDGAIDDASTEVFIDTANQKIKLNIAGNLSTDGVTLKALYSFLKEEWLNDPQSKNLPSFAFPMTPITDESFEFGDGWDLEDTDSKNLIRTAGWTVRNTSGVATEQWAGIVGLGSIDPASQPYFDQGTGRVDFVLTGQVNQAVQIYSDANGDGTPDFDFRSEFTIYVREEAQVFASANLADIGVGTMAPIAYRFPLSTSVDLNIAETDANIAANAPYTGMSITYHPTSVQRTIGATEFDFGVIIDANGGTKQEVYEFVQYSLRQAADIDDDASAHDGNVQAELLEFVGDVLKTTATSNPDGGGNGVYIDNFLGSDVNTLVFVDNAGTERTFPRKATLSLQIGTNLVGDASAKYWVYFADPDSIDDGDEWGTAGGVLVPEDLGGEMTGNVSANGTIDLTYDYDGDTTSGRTVGTDVPVVVVGIGLETSQYVRANGVISFPTSTVALVAPLERNYAND